MKTPRVAFSPSLVKCKVVSPLTATLCNGEIQIQIRLHCTNITTQILKNIVNKIRISGFSVVLKCKFINFRKIINTTLFSSINGRNRIFCRSKCHFTSPLQGVPGSIMDTYCWIHSTFSIPERFCRLQHCVCTVLCRLVGQYCTVLYVL